MATTQQLVEKMQRVLLRKEMHHTHKKKKQTPHRSNKKKQNHINPTLKGITAATKIGILGYRTEAHRTDRRVAIIIMRLINEPC